MRGGEFDSNYLSEVGLLTVLEDFLTNFYRSLVTLMNIHKSSGVGQLNIISQLSSNVLLCPTSPSPLPPPLLPPA